MELFIQLKTTANSTFATMAGEEQLLIVVHIKNFGAGGQLSVPSATSQICIPLAVMLENHEIETHRTNILNVLFTINSRYRADLG